ncbi:hypothetical protein ACKGJO_05080 [Gracilimonas sp. Q87]|uniref:hypothetical protein n=1 Tax=Gracilimonas sp. Q87 TaxID=3384766 RepID=UPI003983E912
MLWIVVSTIIVSLVSIYLGHSRLLHIDQITPRRSSITLILVLLLFLSLQLLHRIGYFPEAAAGFTMANMYASLFGFFFGASIQQFNQKMDAGKILYVNRSFWTDVLPNVIALGVILFGIQRTSIFSDIPITPIRVTSGLSIIAFGLYGLTIRLVPEFRAKGLILLDRQIKWDDFVTYSWFSEGVIEIEYKQNGAIKSFKTMIPEEDELYLEKTLSKKIAERLENDEF